MHALKVVHMKNYFTAENAAEMQRRSRAAIAAKKAAEEELIARCAAVAAPANEIANKGRILMKIEQLTIQLLDVDDAIETQRLTNALNTLWHMLNPSTGSMRVKGSSRATARPQPIMAQSPVAVALTPDSVVN